MGEPINEVQNPKRVSDFKSHIQEHFFALDKDVKIEYSVTAESGPPHKRWYTSQVAVNGRVLGAGEGNTKKESEQNAAREALARI